MQLLQDNLTRWLLYSTDTPLRPCLYHPLLTANARVVPCGNATPSLPLQPHPCHKCHGGARSVTAELYAHFVSHPFTFSDALPPPHTPVTSTAPSLLKMPAEG